MLTDAMTEPTPMITPSMVNSERILFRRSARPASLKGAKNFIEKL